ncbi:MAG: peptide ABC transporter substrate-binding protein [Gemmatimonadetes bacterium]|nr:peptide ABC transporter substrate-binding protein [Gemmatimonadota bacterium]
MSRRVCLLALATTLAACSSGERAAPAGDDGGTLIVAVAGEPSTLFPPRVEGTIDAAVVGTMFERLADIGPALETIGDEGFTPVLARSWRWAPDSLSIAFTLDSTARWHDGAPLRAEDVRFTWRVYADDSVAANERDLIGNIDSVSVPDARTAVVWFKRRTPQQFYDATYHMKILPSHRLDSIPFARLATSAAARAPVGTGRFRFARWDAGQRIEVVADTTHPRGRPHLDRVVWSIMADQGAATVKLFAGEADLLENFRRDNLEQLARTPSLRVVTNPSLTYYFLGFHLREGGAGSAPHPIFGDLRVRRALSMAVDRATLVRNVFDSLAVVGLGPAPRALIPDTTVLRAPPFDVAQARALLDSAGWVDANGDGVRERGGRPLAFELLAPSSSAARTAYATLLQAQFAVVGAKVSVAVLDPAVFTERTDKGRFDAYLGGWQPSPGLIGMRQTWMSRGADNVVGYANPRFDALADSALTGLDRARSRRLWGDAFAAIVDDAPAIWLYEARMPIGLHTRLVLPPLRADGWYTNLAEWRVDPARRLDRDRIGLGGAR